MFLLGALVKETLEAATVLMRSLHVKKAWAGFSQKKHTHREQKCHETASIKNDN